MSASRMSALRQFCLRRPVAAACFAASFAAFLAGFAGWIVNQLLSELMAVLGMMMVALFYLALGLWQIAFVPASQEAALRTGEAPDATDGPVSVPGLSLPSVRPLAGGVVNGRSPATPSAVSGNP